MPPRRSPKRVLILGGTAEARALAQRLGDDKRFTLTTSLAGITTTPVAIAGPVRTGGFGGSAGLAAYIRATMVDIVIDATHPFAIRISANAARAAADARCTVLRLCRPPWLPRENDDWTSATDVAHAADLIETGATVLLTVGGKQLQPFAARRDVTIHARMIEAPAEPLPDHISVILDRPPFSLEGERSLLRKAGARVLVTKNAGSDAVDAKLDAARSLSVPVIMIERPPGAAPADAETVDEMLALLDHHAT